MYDLYVVGSFGPSDQWHPGHVIKSNDAWPLLARMSKGPIPVREVPENLRVALERVGLIRPVSDTYQLGFAWLTAEDQQFIADKAQSTAQALADALLECRERVDGLLDRLRCRTWTELPDLRFALVGCFGLDWGGLEALKRSGHLVHEKEQPGDRRYVMYVLDRVESLNHKDYTGAHSADVSERYTWTSFGDHSGRRLGLPDLAWHLDSIIQTGEALPQERRPAIADAFLQMSYSHMSFAAADLVTMVEGGTPDGLGQSLLEATGALIEGRPAVPVFFKWTDGALIDEVVGIVQGATVPVIEQHYDTLARSLHSITPSCHDIPFGESFNYIWHEIFGQTNRILAEAGYLADPVPQFSGEGRYRWWLTVNS